MKVGLIGLGNIGYHFASRLLGAGYELTVYDRNAAAQQRVVEKGAQGVDGIAELASQTDVVLLCLPLPSIVADVASALIKSSSARIVVDLSTTGPSVTAQIAQMFQEHAIEFVGAPVSGGTASAEKGTLAVMAAGSEATVKKVEPLLKVLGKNLFYLGEDPTLGQTMKIINNTLYAASLIASSEALVYGVKAGLDAQAMLDVLNVSSGRSFATLERIPQCVMDRSFPLRFTTELLHKDVKLCVDEAEKLGVPMALGPVVRQFLAFSITQGHGPKDNASVIQHFEHWAGVQFGKAPA